MKLSKRSRAKRIDGSHGRGIVASTEGNTLYESVKRDNRDEKVATTTLQKREEGGCIVKKERR